MSFSMLCVKPSLPTMTMHNEQIKIKIIPTSETLREFILQELQPIMILSVCLEAVLEVLLTYRNTLLIFIFIFKRRKDVLMLT